MEDYLFASYEAALERAGVDFETDAEQLLTEYIFPALEELQKTYLTNDEAALDIYRSAGLDEIKVRWRNFDTAKLSFLQKRRIKKIAEELELLSDAQLHFVILGMVVYKRRPDLKEKYGEMEVWMTGDR